MKRHQHDSNASRQGFTLLELLIVVSLGTIVIAMAVPNVVRGVHTANFRNAANDVAGLLQQARIRAVQDDRYYSVYYLSASSAQQEFVDIYPQNVNGASGNGGSSANSQDPVVAVSAEVSPQLAANAPNTSNLSSQALPTNPYNIQMIDGYASGTPVTFGPEGLPCKPRSVTGGTICTPYNNGSTSGAAAATAYWLFFQDNTTQAWEAVTVTPAGRIRKWYYDGVSTWSQM